MSINFNFAKRGVMSLFVVLLVLGFIAIVPKEPFFNSLPVGVTPIPIVEAPMVEAFQLSQHAAVPTAVAVAEGSSPPPPFDPVTTSDLYEVTSGLSYGEVLEGAREYIKQDPDGLNWDELIYIEWVEKFFDLEGKPLDSDPLATPRTHFFFATWIIIHRPEWVGGVADEDRFAHYFSVYAQFHAHNIDENTAGAAPWEWHNPPSWLTP